VLLDYGLAEPLIEKLVQAGIGTVEKLGGMTPEEIEAVPELLPEWVDAIQQAVHSYYSQFETSEPEAEEVVPADEYASVDAAAAAAHTLAETAPDETADAAVEDEPVAKTPQSEVSPASGSPETDGIHGLVAAEATHGHSGDVEAGESDRIGNTD
jgi:N utilization substance protein A